MEGGGGTQRGGGGVLIKKTKRWVRALIQRSEGFFNARGGVRGGTLSKMYITYYVVFKDIQHRLHTVHV